jgi:hypothetical protein
MYYIMEELLNVLIHGLAHLTDQTLTQVNERAWRQNIQ